MSDFELNVKQAAHILGYSEGYMYRLMRREKIPYRIKGGRYYISRLGLINWISSHAKQMPRILENLVIVMKRAIAELEKSEPVVHLCAIDGGMRKPEWRKETA